LRKRVLPVLMIIALILAGCGEAAALEKGFTETRERWFGAETIAFTAGVSAEFADSRFDCTLKVEKNGEETIVEVVEPENISGIKARLRAGETEIEFDGVVLAVGNAVGERSPLAAMPLLMDALLQGYPRSMWRESEGEAQYAVAEVYISETDYALLWLDGENFSPVHMELVSGGKAVVKCEILSFTGE